MNRNTVWARTLVDELVRAGVREVCVAPGSRSTPVVLACAERDELRLFVHVDERSAGFFAVGVGKASGRPAAVLTTSGTATANLYPAVVEASQAETPLLVLTADRPHRLRDADANQAIDQLRLYGTFVRAFVEVAPPSVDGPALRHLRSTVSRAVAEAVGLPAGPVHLNLPFDKPLEPGAGPDDVPAGFADAHPRAWRGREGGAPYTRVGRRTPGASEEELEALAERLRTAERAVMVAGPCPEPGRSGPALRRLAAAAGVPLLADPLSGARYGGPDGADVVGAYDLVLASPEVAAALEPDLVLRFGQAPTSANLLRWLEGEASGAAQVVVDPGGRWKDHLATATDYLRADAAGLALALAERVARAGTPAWRERWRRLEATARRTAAGALAQAPCEGAVLAAAVEAAPEGGTLFVSSSMPVRDLDAFGGPRSRALTALGNRGASGIDGIVSTALGVAAGAGAPAVAVLGDLALMHDMNGLLATREEGVEVVFVVIHNDGGGIFHMLPVREEEPHFTPYFATPHGLDFRHAAALYGLPYARLEGPAGVGEALAEALQAGGSRILEVRSDREENRRRRRAVVEAVGAALLETLKEEGGP